jgi:ABC-type Mn2+/Zn2+ transport system permease subunit
MTDTWVVATIVAVVAGVVGFFVVLRGSAFVADALPTGAFAGAAWARFLAVVALATSMALPVVGALLIFSLMIGPPAAARSVTSTAARRTRTARSARLASASARRVLA